MHFSFLRLVLQDDLCQCLTGFAETLCVFDRVCNPACQMLCISVWAGQPTYAYTYKNTIPGMWQFR